MPMLNTGILLAIKQRKHNYYKFLAKQVPYQMDL